jgi:predicted aspartyl protease
MKIRIFVTYDNRKVETPALIDCGAKGANYISRSFVNKCQIPLLKLSKPIPVLNVDGTENQDGAIQEYVDVLIEVKGRERRLSLLVTSLGRETVILGYPWLRQENPDINWETQTLQWRNEKPHRIKMIEAREQFEQ